MTQRKASDAFEEESTPPRKTRQKTSPYRLSALVTTDNQQHLCPINYVYDCLPAKPSWLQSQQIDLDNLPPGKSDCPKIPDLKLPARRCGQDSVNGIVLDLEAAHFPTHTGMRPFKQSKHWRQNATACRELLDLFAHDDRCSRVILANGTSMAELASRQLGNEKVMDTYSRFSIYMFAEADVVRIQLLAQCVVLIFMFDGQCFVSILLREGIKGPGCLSSLALYQLVTKLRLLQTFGRTRLPMWSVYRSLALPDLFETALFCFQLLVFL